MNWIEQRDSDAWLAEAIRYYRTFGFFSGEEYGSSDKAVIRKAKAYHGADWEELAGLAPDRTTAEMWLLVTDTSRVWFHDLEGVYPGENFYASNLREWATISRGVFTPEQISETWLGNDGPANVSFTFRGAQHTFVHADGRDDFMDVGIIRMINQLIQDSGYRFERCDNLGDCRFIVVLNPDERARLKRERGWEFCDFSSTS